MSAQTKQHIVFLIALAICAWVVITLTTGAAYAAPAPPESAPCRPDLMAQQDMAGTYERSQMKVEIFPCGGSLIVWSNQYGEHYAMYTSTYRMEKGGYITEGYIPDPEINAFLDSSTVMMLVPADPGWINVATFTQQHEVFQVYRLRKVR